MARVEDWFGDFTSKLIERSLRGDWPGFEDEAGIEFWADFKRSLIRCGASEDEADEASSAACDVPDLWPNQYRPMVIAAIKGLQARKQAEQKGQGGSGPNSIDEAKTASKGCPDCDGNGLAVRFLHPDLVGRFVSPGGKPFPPGARVVLLCSTCPLGNLIRRLNAEAPRESRHRMASLADFAGLATDPRYRHHPDDWNAIDGIPMPTASPEEVRQMVRHALASGKASRSSPGRRWGVGPIEETSVVPDAYSERVEAREQEARQPTEYPDLAGGYDVADPVELATEAPGWF